MKTKVVIVLDPTSPAKNGETRATPGLPKLKPGTTVGFLWNSKPNGDILLSIIRETLSQRYQLAPSPWYQKDVPAVGASAQALSEMTAACSLVITALAD